MKNLFKTRKKAGVIAPAGLKSFTNLSCEKVSFGGGTVDYDESAASLQQELFDGSIRVGLVGIYGGDGCAIVFSDRAGNEIFRETVFLRSGFCDVFPSKMEIADDAGLFTLKIRNMAELWVTVYRAEWAYPKNTPGHSG